MSKMTVGKAIVLWIALTLLGLGATGAALYFTVRIVRAAWQG